jgi:hypothetical protein
MGTSKPPVVVAVVEDAAPSRTARGRLLQAAGFGKPVDGNILTATIASVANR